MDVCLSHCVVLIQIISLIFHFDPIFTSSDYICVRSAVVHAAVVSDAATDTEASMSAGASHDEHDDASKAAAIKAFHTAIRSTSRCVLGV